MTIPVSSGSDDDVFTGLLFGTAMADALGLPFEGLSARRGARMYPGELRHRLVGRRGMCSDDTEHAWMTAQALLAAGEDADRFGRALAWRLRWWFLALPAGLGMATARACLRLWLGFPPDKSGVRSAGNGPAMRAPVIGAFYADSPERLRLMNRVSARLTHRDPRAEEGAWVIAVAAACAVRRASAHQMHKVFFETVMPQLRGEELHTALGAVAAALAERVDPAAFAVRLQRKDRVGGYVNHTVPAVIYAWLRHYGDYRATVEYLIGLGGDTDTTAAIAGALAGIVTGRKGIPQSWLDGMAEWPAGLPWLAALAQRLRAAKCGREEKKAWLCWPAIPLRNLLFLCVVLAHGFRRLLPPY